MNARLLLIGTLAGAVTLFAWETISNTVIPWHRPTMRSFADSNVAVQAIKAQAPVNGMYVDARGVVAAVSFTPDMRDKSSLLGVMLARQFAVDLVVACLVLLVLLRLPKAAALQYGVATALMALAVAASVLVSDWNWYGFGAGWSLVNTLDRAIGYGLMGLTLGAVINRFSSRVRTDEWGGIRAPAAGGYSSKVGAPTPRSTPAR